MNWLILSYGQTKPKHLIKLPSDGHKYYNCSHCKGPGNVKVVHHKHNYPNYFLKGDLSYHLIKRGRVGLKTDNLIHLDGDVAKNKEQQLRQPWRGQALTQFKKLTNYLGLSLIPSPSGGFQTEYPRHWKQEVKNGNLYFSSKETNHEYLHFGEIKAQGGYVAHPLSKDRLGTITMDKLLEWLEWGKKQKENNHLSNLKSPNEVGKWS